MHVLFVLVSLLSIFIYKKILLKEFNSLYSISEDSLTKLKEKFKCVEEIIKSEKYPSKVYMDLRRMREAENFDKNNKNKKPNQQENGIKTTSSLGNENKKSTKKNIIGMMMNNNNNVNNNPNTNLGNSNQNTNNNLINLTKNIQPPTMLNNNSPNKLSIEKPINKVEEVVPLNQNNNKFLSPNHISKNGKIKTNLSKLERKATAISQNLSDSKDKALENYYSYNYSGATKGLLKSMSIKNREKMEEIKKQHSKAQASMMLLSRLNFEFEFINNYVKFIVFMSVFYISLGILVLLILKQKYETFNKSLTFMDTFIDKNVNIYNYLIGVKLAIILNRKWPNTIKPETFQEYSKYKFENMFDLKDPIDISKLNNYGFYTEQGIINNFYNATNIIFEMETKYSFFDDIFSYEASFNGENTCSLIFNY